MTVLIRLVLDFHYLYLKIKEMLPKRVKKAIKIILRDGKILGKSVIKTTRYGVKLILFFIQNIINILAICLISLIGYTAYKVYHTSYDKCFTITSPVPWAENKEICISEWINSTVQFIQNIL